MASPTTMRLVDDVSGVEFPIQLGTGDVRSPVKCVSYDLGFPEAREVVQDIPGQSGTVDDTQWFGSRTVTLNLTAKDGELAPWGVLTRHQWVDKLRSFARPSLRPWLYIRCEGWEQERRLRLRPSGLSCTVDGKGKVIIPVTLTYKAPSGTMQAVEATTGTIYPLAPNAGISFPISWTSTGIAFDAGSSPNSAVLTNQGSETAYPLLRIYGQGTNPIITKKGTGEVVALNTTIQPGHYVDIDMAERTVYLDSDPSLSLYGFLDLNVTTWWGLDPGPNEVAFTVSNADNSCQLYYEYSDEWI
ncbi:hypothetical protein ABZ215_38490 [Amycolatopsis sp. NPDC006131]|uniref:phage distal tail protein n=1 Tax=Amycolatopsis sp. NPDC006131 TaxID=3156731 RepID=UPI0033AE823E